MVERADIQVPVEVLDAARQHFHDGDLEGVVEVLLNHFAGEVPPSVLQEALPRLLPNLENGVRWAIAHGDTLDEPGDEVFDELVEGFRTVIGREVRIQEQVAATEIGSTTGQELVRAELERTMGDLGSTILRTAGELGIPFAGFPGPYKNNRADTSGISGITGTPRPADAPAGGRHHPDIERYREAVDFFFSEAGHPEDTDYAMMVMWGESMGQPNATGQPTTDWRGRDTVARGLFQHLESAWPERVRAARSFWKSKGIDIGTNINDPATNIAVAAWLRARGGWGHWSAVHHFFPEGSWVDGQTQWDGYRYTATGVTPPHRPPIGDGRVADDAAPNTSEYPFIHPLPEGRNPTHGGLFGDDRDDGARRHEGLDFGAAEGTPIRATYAGRVVAVGNSGTGAPVSEGAGNVVIIDHGDGWTSDYFHIADGQTFVEVGDVVQTGQVIAGVGDTGNSDGPHLHFQTKYRGEPVDPMSLGVLTNKGGTIGSPVAPTPEGPTTRRSYADSLWRNALNTISNQVAGGARLSLNQLRRQADPSEDEALLEVNATNVGDEEVADAQTDVVSSAQRPI